MLRSPSISSRYNDDLSSPDPLATFINDDNSTDATVHKFRKTAPRRSSISTSKSTARHLKSSSTSQSIDVYPSSPFRAVSEQNISPWKIRVTIEAEPEDIDMDGNYPATRTRTRTSTIPLQSEALFDCGTKSSVCDRASRRSSGNQKRSATPVRGSRNSSRTRRQSVTNLDVIPLGDDAEEDDWLKQQKSPRKRSSRRKSTATADTQACRSSSPAKSKTNSSGADFEVRPDTDVEDDDRAGEPGPVMQEDSPELKKPDLNQIAVRPRALSTKKQDSNDCSEQTPARSDRPTQSSRQSQWQARKVSANSAMSYPTPSPTSSYHGDSDDRDKLDGEEPATGQGGFDTIIESEGFTMIDLETLPSVKQKYLSSPLEENPSNGSALEQEGQPSLYNPATRLNQRDVVPSPTAEAVIYPTLTVDESEISSTVPSSPPMSEKNGSLLNVSSSARPGLTRKVTPLPLSSPKLPSPPRHQIRQTPRHQHRASASALFAGIALQSVVSPEEADKRTLPNAVVPAQKSSSPPGEAPLFGGFDSGTQRELRAGLRFGEELGKREFKSASAQAGPVQSQNDPKIQSSASASNKKSGQEARHTGTNSSFSQLAPHRDLTNDTIENAPQTPQSRVSKSPEHRVLDTQARREAEWQLEREAVSRQINNASESQVIIIDSDSEHEESDAHAEEGIGDDTDIWLAEAKNPSSPQAISQAKSDSPFTHTEQQRQRERANEVIGRPRRSLIPSPWKRGEDLPAGHEQSTFLSTYQDELSGLNFYSDPANQVRFGAGQIKNQQLRQRSNSGKFDIDLMAGTPKKDDTQQESFAISEEDQTDDSHAPEPSLSEPCLPDQNESSQTPIVVDDRFNGNESVNSNSELLETLELPPQPLRVPVNFNDSSISIPTPTPQPQRFQTRRESEVEHGNNSPPRPPTPRSAMKGTRENFLANMSPVRRVVFSGRSRGVDIDGQENSFSMRSASEDSFGGEVGTQLKQELHAVETQPIQMGRGQREIQVVREVSCHPVASQAVPEQEVVKETAANGWTSWIFGSKQVSNNDSQMNQHSDLNRARPVPNSRSSKPAHASSQHRAEEPQEQAWQPTKSSIPSITNKMSPPASTTQKHPPVPSYLLPPSYPSDPSRPPNKPLSLSGSFTNTHFRTLHIIYRKSLRPKFHPPSPDQIRAGVRALRGTQMIVDESANGLVKGEFVWTVGDAECEVLERFMQECEYSNGWFLGRNVSGAPRAREVKWGWSVDELAGRLCRIVVGEVVREEERKARVKEDELKAHRSR